MKRLLTILIFTTSASYSQSEVIEPDTVITPVQIILTNGKKIEGIILTKARDFFTIKTMDSDTLQIATRRIVGIIPLATENQIQKSDLPQFESQFDFKYFLFNTAIPVGEKKWVYSNQYVVISNVNYGISKKLSAGISFFTFNPAALFSPKLKFTFNPEAKIKVAITAQYLYAQIRKSNSVYENFNYGFLQASVTKVNPKSNFTLSIGKSISKSGIEQGYVATIGLSKRIAPKLSIISENNLLIGTDIKFTLGLLSIGFRIDRKKHAFDLGIFAPAIIDQLNVSPRPLPFISYNLKLNR